MAGADDVLDALRRGAERRRALLVTLGVIAGATVVLEVIATSPLGAAVYDGLGLAWLWPLVVGALGGFFLRAGVLVHRQDGRPQRFPYWAVFTVLAIAAVAAMKLADTAAQWSLLQAGFALIVLVAGAVLAAIGAVGYGELWRTFWNKPTVTTVLRTLPPATDGLISTFRTIVERQRAQGDWGSPHGLAIVEAVVTARSAPLILDRGGHLPAEAYDLYLETGDDLLAYYELRWPSEVLPAEELSHRRLTLVGRLLSVWLKGTRAQREPFDEAARRWYGELGKAEDPYYRFQAYCFALGDSRRTDVAESVQAALSLYVALRETAGSRGGELAERVTCQNTWLAHAPRVLPPQACYDAWMAMRRLEGQGSLLLPPPSDAEREWGWARRFLADHYRGWARETHEDWRRGLAGASGVSEWTP